MVAKEGFAKRNNSLVYFTHRYEYAQAGNSKDQLIAEVYIVPTSSIIPQSSNQIFSILAVSRRSV